MELLAVNNRKVRKVKGEELMKVYIITKGEYSDYHICAVATDKEKAEALREKFSDHYDNAEIEEYDTDDYGEILRYKSLYFCAYYNNSDDIVVERNQCWDYPFNDYKVRETKYGLMVYVNADDYEMALKKASDKFAQYRAEVLGL